MYFFHPPNIEDDSIILSNGGWVQTLFSSKMEELISKRYFGGQKCACFGRLSQLQKCVLEDYIDEGLIYFF